MFEHHTRLLFSGNLKGKRMSAQRSMLVAMICVLGSLTAHAQNNSTEAVQRRLEIDANAKSTLDDLMKTQPTSKELYERAVGYAVFTATKAGFIVSGGSGTGVAVNKKTGARTYMRMGMGGIGLGIGAQRYSLIILFETDSHLDKFVAGGWDSSATAEAAAGQEGVAMRSSFYKGVAFYQITDKGLMAHADVTGTKFWVIDELK
jgi:lipid-binding SYLF domain-containing protein